MHSVQIPIVLEPLQQFPETVERNMAADTRSRGQGGLGSLGPVFPAGGQALSNQDGVDGLPGTAKDVERANVGLTS